jgi:hypothetical protein
VHNTRHMGKIHVMGPSHIGLTSCILCYANIVQLYCARIFSRCFPRLALGIFILKNVLTFEGDRKKKIKKLKIRKEEKCGSTVLFGV